MSRAGEQRRRCQSMKSYPSSELRNVCEAQGAAVEPPEESEDLLQQMLERRWDSHSHHLAAHQEVTRGGRDCRTGSGPVYQTGLV